MFFTTRVLVEPTIWTNVIPFNLDKYSVFLCFFSVSCFVSSYFWSFALLAVRFGSVRKWRCDDCDTPNATHFVHTAHNCVWIDGFVVVVVPVPYTLVGSPQTWNWSNTKYVYLSFFVASVGWCCCCCRLLISAMFFFLPQNDEYFQKFFLFIINLYNSFWNAVFTSVTSNW